MHTFRGGSKLKLKKLKTKDRMKRSEDKKKAKLQAKEDEKEGVTEKREKEVQETNLKMKTLFQKIQFIGKPKIVDLTSESLFPSNLEEYKTVCSEDTKALYLY
jgi:hypothetical protein